MSDGTLSIFGCAVSFIALGGAYVYVRERFTAAESSNRSEGRGAREELRRAA